ncbi:hypothetical protein LUX12_15135 [Streptomyces somaliensis]|uniref:hypothetical protein n=1 Tax=Streptomyces somaliensis TaxID=78355 RepID=UPI0020CDE32E|nr:hypothetical protein [Streptomyces somaliensis]MCP9945824.1 hypothetical protein [Streptomyces somaliensis]MCP9961003.1 hypothetical protein [Streptomyces somaliensis]MCP9973788.1 hypothetical protein [Streptomyces somaliensis]
MGLFNRKKDTETPANPAMAEMGREFAIARRHGDRKTMRRIGREFDNTARTDADAASFQQGQEAYDALPPINPPRRNRRRR